MGTGGLQGMTSKRSFLANLRKRPKINLNLKIFHETLLCILIIRNLYFPERAAAQTAYRSSIPETFYIFIVRVDLENDRNLICTAHHTIRVLCHTVLVENAVASWNKELAVTFRYNV